MSPIITVLVDCVNPLVLRGYGRRKFSMIGTLGVLALALILCGVGLWMDYANRKSMEPRDEKRKAKRRGKDER
jgi:hypothetical protein